MDTKQLASGYRVRCSSDSSGLSGEARTTGRCRDTRFPVGTTREPALGGARRSRKGSHGIWPFPMRDEHPCWKSRVISGSARKTGASRRHFGRGRGGLPETVLAEQGIGPRDQLAKTDQVDDGVLARYGHRECLAATPPLDAALGPRRMSRLDIRLNIRTPGRSGRSGRTSHDCLA